MQSQPVDWVPALSMLAVGVVVGIALILWFRRGAAARAAGAADSPLEMPELDVRDLEAQRDALLAQLRQLDETAAAKLTPQQLAHERYRLELEAAHVLRALEEHEPVEAPEGEPADESESAPATVPQSAAAGFLWGVGSMAAIAALVVLVVQRASPREEGGSATGSVPSMQAPVAADIAALQRAVDADPDDLNARIELAYGFLAQRDLMSVFNQTEFVLQREPNNTRALSLQALVRLAMGQTAEAETMLKKALETDPDLLDAWIHLAIVYQQTGKNAEALAAIQEAMRRHPEERPTLESLARELQGVPAMPPGEGTAAATQPQAAVTAGPSVSGTIELAPGVSASGGQLFIAVRPAGVAAGPPIAVKMMGSVPFPASFTITSGDSMMGQPLPEKMRVDVRLDSDGNVMSRTPGDPQATADNVALGASGLKLVLR